MLFRSNVIAQGTVVASPVRTNVWQINLVPTVDATDYVIQIAPSTLSTAVSPLSKIFVSSGKTYAGNQFWLNNSYQYASVPVITATDDYLYYQDSSNPGFVGTIKLVDNSTTTIDVATDIIGKSGYTAPNGVIFTNGLKIQFDTSVTPSTYADNEYYVEGVGTGIALVQIGRAHV